MKMKLWPVVGQPVLLASRLVAWALGRAPGNPASRIFAKHGLHLQRKDYNLPIPQEEDVANGFWEKQSDMVGVDMNEPFALDMLERELPRYAAEFRALFPNEPTDDPARFYLLNGSYMAVDAHVYYAFIRHFKPGRIVEVGAGNSTLLAAAAGSENRTETGRAPRLTAIEPYPNPTVKKGFAGLDELVEAKVQDVPLERFMELSAGDILFIDSSHVLRAGGDVQLEYLEILPRLAPGVIVHIHDVSLPKGYPRTYYEHGLYWNEAYLLQAFLCFNSAFEVLWPGSFMMARHGESLRKTFPEIDLMRRSFPQAEPSAFWIRRRLPA